MRWPFSLTTLLLAVISVSCSAQSPAISSDAVALIERTRTTDATYSLFLWNRIDVDDVLSEEWSAEFHSGHLHRVETPNVRVIANCALQTGHMLDLRTGAQKSGPEVARGACGINANTKMQSARVRGMIDTSFGKARRIELIDEADVRVYDIAASGALLRTTYAAKASPEKYIIITEARAFSTDKPDPTMFSRASLNRSFVPDPYRQPPD